jgi:site-specific DNA recombinase
MKTAIIYTRFSPRPNANECESSEGQEDRCREYCKSHGYNVWNVYDDPCVSGGDLERPGLNSAISALQEGNVLVVDRCDRLARDMLVNLMIRARVQKAGATIEFADGSPLDVTPEGELFQNILAAFAQYERAKIRKRTKDGLARKRKNGIALGKPPIGYMRVKGRSEFVECPEERQVIEWIQKYTGLGMTPEHIEETFKEQGRLLRGRQWTARTIRRVIARYCNQES